MVGGHIETGETPEEAARREAYEETGARLRELHVLGYQRLRLFGPRPVSYRYSYPDSYQVFYWAQIEALDEFLPTEEARERALFAPDDACELPWVQTKENSIWSPCKPLGVSADSRDLLCQQFRLFTAKVVADTLPERGEQTSCTCFHLTTSSSTRTPPAFHGQ